MADDARERNEGRATLGATLPKKRRKKIAPHLRSWQRDEPPPPGCYSLESRTPLRMRTNVRCEVCVSTYLKKTTHATSAAHNQRLHPSRRTGTRFSLDAASRCSAWVDRFSSDVETETGGGVGGFKTVREMLGRTGNEEGRVLILSCHLATDSEIRGAHFGFLIARSSPNGAVGSLSPALLTKNGSAVPAPGK